MDRRDALKALGAAGLALGLSQLAPRAAEALENPFIVSKYSGVSPASAIVFREGDYAVAIDGRTKEVIARSADHMQVLRSAVERGGTITLIGDFDINVSGLPSYTRVLPLKSGARIVGHGARIRVHGSPEGEVWVLAVVGASDSFVEDVAIEGVEVDLTDAERAGAIHVEYARRVDVHGVRVVDSCDDPDKAYVFGVRFGLYGADVKYMNYDVAVRGCSLEFRGVRNSPSLSIYWSCRARVLNNYIKGSDPDVEQDPAKRGPISIQGSRDLVVEGNVIYRGHHNAIFFADSTSSGRSSENVVIRGNIIIEPEDDHVDPNNTKRLVVAENVMINGSKSLGWVTPEDSCEDVVIVGNVMVGAGYVSCGGSRRIAVVGNMFVHTERWRNYIELRDCEDCAVLGNLMYNATCGVRTQGSTRHVVVKGNVVRLSGYGDKLLYAMDSSERILVEGNIYDVLDETWSRPGRIEHTTVKHVYFINNLRGALGRAEGPELGEGVDPLAQSIVANNVGPDRNIGLEYPRCNWRARGRATLDGDGSTTDFLIGEHGLGVKVEDPTKFLVRATPASPDAIAASPCVGYLSDEDGDGVYESIRVKFASAPPSGTDNVKVAWEVEYVG